jgi:hypothetical protein
MTLFPRPVSEIIAYLLARDPLPPLVSTGTFDDSLTDEIEASALPGTLKAGLHVLNDDLAASHALVQRLEGDPMADYWHAIIHRREGDYGNARYWFGHVTGQPILAEVYGADPTAPNAFVERCRAVGTGRNAALEQFQRDEIAKLLAYQQEHAA